MIKNKSNLEYLHLIQKFNKYFYTSKVNKSKNLDLLTQFTDYGFLFDLNGYSMIYKGWMLENSFNIAVSFMDNNIELISKAETVKWTTQKEAK